MMNRVKKMLGRSRLSTVTSVESYFGAVNKPGESGGPTFEEAQRDFRDIHGRLSSLHR